MYICEVNAKTRLALIAHGALIEMTLLHLVKEVPNIYEKSIWKDFKKTEPT